MEMTWLRAAGMAAIVGLTVACVQAGDKVSIRAPGGRFLHAAEDGAVRAERLFPTEQELFDLIPRDNGRIVLKAPSGRFLVAEGRDARQLRSDSPRTEPGEREIFTLVPLDGNRVGLRAQNFRSFLLFDPNAPVTNAPTAALPEKPTPAETIEIYSTVRIPDSLRSLLASLIRDLATEELKGKQYDKTRTRRTEKSLDLPSPTRHDLFRTKPQRVLSVTEEYQVQARLDGPVQIDIQHLPLLKGFRDRGASRLMFVVQATIPVAGHVRWSIPDRLSASTGFRTTARLALTGEIRSQKSGDEIALSSPELLEFRVELQQLDLSNDVLHTLRRPIEDLVNHELKRNEDRIRAKANESLAKAFKARQLEHPLLRYLAFP